MRVFVVTISRAGEEVDAKSVEATYYWIPDGTEHHCIHFDCPEVSRYAVNMIQGTQGSLMPCTGAVDVNVEATLAQ